jgi:D-aminoacyl-tRNA deacylase
MRAVVQRVTSAAVVVSGATVGSVGRGLLIFLGVGQDDTEEDAVYLVDKVAGLRIFPDQQGQMNLSLATVAGEVLVVSQFTLCGDCRKGRRPSYSGAAPAEKAEQLYRVFVDRLRSTGLRLAEGVFGAMMQVSLVNDGPVTLLLDSRRLF